MSKAAQLEAYGWVNAACCYTKTFDFKVFSEALAFIQQVGVHAERTQHHPQLINTYTKVTLNLWTHDTGGITAQDEDWILSFEQQRDENEA